MMYLEDLENKLKSMGFKPFSKIHDHYPDVGVDYDPDTQSNYYGGHSSDDLFYDYGDDTILMFAVTMSGFSILLEQYSYGYFYQIEGAKGFKANTCEEVLEFLEGNQ